MPNIQTFDNFNFKHIQTLSSMACSITLNYLIQITKSHIITFKIRIVIVFFHGQVMVEKNELQDETSTLQNQISELKSIIKERSVQSNLDLNAPAIESQEPQLPQYFPHEIIRLPSGDPLINPVFVIPTCHNVQVHPQQDSSLVIGNKPVSNVSKPNPRYPTPSDSWPFQLLEKPSQEAGENQQRERV